MPNSAPRPVPQHERLASAALQAFAGGDLPTTETLCRQLIGIAPRDPRPWNLLAETAVRRNRPDAAHAAAERAVSLAPHDPMALLIRAKCLTLAGDRRKATEAALAVLVCKRLPVPVLDGLGAVFGMLGQHDRALDLFRRAVIAEPGNPQFLYNLAASERMTGAFADAERHCDRAVSIDPHFYQAHYLRADLRHWDRGRNHVAALETLIQRKPRSWQGEVMLRYAAGKECEDLGDYARAYAHIAAGAALHRRQYRYEVAADIARIEQVIAAPPPVPAEAVPDRPGPIFVMGLPRAGTTLVERIIASHPACVSVGETGLLPRLAAECDDAALGDAWLAALDSYDLPGASRVIDKTLQNDLLAARIIAGIPNARIIWVTRNPMDQGWALLKALFAGPFPYSYDQTELGAYIRAHHRLMRHFQATLAGFLVVAYEDIVADQSAASRRILDFLDLPWDDEVLQFHAAAGPSATASAVQVRQKIYATSVDKWRRYEAELAPLRRALGEDGVRLSAEVGQEP